TLGEKSGTGHSATTFVLGTAASSVDDTYNGMSLYIPETGDITKITDYTGATKTCALEKTLPGTPANNTCYMLCRGSFGYAAINPLSGIVAPVPFRVWLDDPNNVIEAILPTDDSAFSIQAILLEDYRKSNGDFKKQLTWNPNVLASFSIQVSSSFI